MVELALPERNSKTWFSQTLTEGKVWPKPQGANRTREFKVYRWSPDDDAKNPRVDTYMSTWTIAGRWCSTRSSRSRTRSIRR
jgi:hypothetical protein